MLNTEAPKNLLQRNSILVSAEQINHYRDQGFLILPQLFKGEECDWLVNTYMGHADEEYSIVLNLDRDIPDIRERIVKNPAIVDNIEALVGSEMLGCQTFFFFKKPGTRYALQSWNPHQDNSYPRAEPGAYIAVLIALDDHHPENGGLYLYKGSQKDGLLPFEPWTGYHEAPGTNPGNRCIVPEKYANTKVDLYLNRGDILVFDGNLIHASYPNRSATLFRRSIVINYIKKGVPFISGRTAKRTTFSLR